MSIKEVANIAGVSIATVSRFFNNPSKVSSSTRERVADAIEQINYSPNALAQNLRRGKTGLIIAVVNQLSSPFYSAVIDHLSRYASTKGYTLLSQQTSENNPPTLEDYEHRVRSKQADGFILFTNFPEQKHPINIENKPAIVLACEIPIKAKDNDRVSVGIDDFKAALDATEYLINQGHTKIAFIHTGLGSTAVKQRFLGYLAATKAHQIQLEENVVDNLNEDICLERKLDYIIGLQPRPTALFCADDDIAIKTLHFLKAQSLKVPEDISLIGFNNSPYSALTDPPLTTIEAPIETIATRAFDCLVSLMNNEQEPAHQTTLEHALIERKSTQAPN